MTFCDIDKSIRICSGVEITYIQFESRDIYRKMHMLESMYFKNVGTAIFSFPECALLPRGLCEFSVSAMLTYSLLLLCSLTSTHPMGSSSDIAFYNSPKLVKCIF